MSQRMVLQCGQCPQVERDEELLELDRDEWAAVGNLVRAGLVDPVTAGQAQARRTPLRLVRSVG